MTNVFYDQAADISVRTFMAMALAYEDSDCDINTSPAVYWASSPDQEYWLTLTDSVTEAMKEGIIALERGETLLGLMS